MIETAQLNRKDILRECFTGHYRQSAVLVVANELFKELARNLPEIVRKDQYRFALKGGVGDIVTIDSDENVIVVEEYRRDVIQICEGVVNETGGEMKLKIRFKNINDRDRHLSLEELTQRWPQMYSGELINSAHKMMAVMGALESELSKTRTDIYLEDFPDESCMKGEIGVWTLGIYLNERVPLVAPVPERYGFLWLRKRMRTHGGVTLVYSDIGEDFYDYVRMKRPNLIVKVNDRSVLEACRKVARTTKGEINVLFEPEQ